MTDRPILVFDSGIGGLTVLREARVLMPDRRFVYVADDAGFPYGDWEEEALRARIVELFGELLATHEPGDLRSSPATPPRRWCSPICARPIPGCRSSAPCRRSSRRRSGRAPAWSRCWRRPAR